MEVKLHNSALEGQEAQGLGHVFVPEGRKPGLTKTKKLLSTRVPQLKELRSFLMFCSFYRRFVHLFGKVVATLHELASRKVLYGWNPIASSAFRNFKKVVSKPPVIASPDGKNNLWFLSMPVVRGGNIFCAKRRNVRSCTHYNTLACHGVIFKGENKL